MFSIRVVVKELLICSLLIGNHERKTSHLPLKLAYGYSVVDSDCLYPGRVSSTFSLAA